MVRIRSQIGVFRALLLVHAKTLSSRGVLRFQSLLPIHRGFVPGLLSQGLFFGRLSQEKFLLFGADYFRGLGHGDLLLEDNLDRDQARRV